MAPIGAVRSSRAPQADPPLNTAPCHAPRSAAGPRWGKWGESSSSWPAGTPACHLRAWRGRERGRLAARGLRRAPPMPALHGCAPRAPRGLTGRPQDPLLVALGGIAVPPAVSQALHHSGLVCRLPCSHLLVLAARDSQEAGAGVSAPLGPRGARMGRPAAHAAGPPQLNSLLLAALERAALRLIGLWDKHGPMPNPPGSGEPLDDRRAVGPPAGEQAALECGMQAGKRRHARPCGRLAAHAPALKAVQLVAPALWESAHTYSAAPAAVQGRSGPCHRLAAGAGLQ